jgi:hypothetical protein
MILIQRRQAKGILGSRWSNPRIASLFGDRWPAHLRKASRSLGVAKGRRYWMIQAVDVERMDPCDRVGKVSTQCPHALVGRGSPPEA